MMGRRSMVVAIAVVALAGTVSARAAEGDAPAPAQAAAKPTAALPYTPSLDLSMMDRAVDPCADFYTYSCGGWMKANPIPPDQPRWSVYGKLTDDNRQFLWGLLNEAAKPDPARAPAKQKIGDLFDSCMDEAAIAKLGAKALELELGGIAALRSTAQLSGYLGRMHLSQRSAGMMFGFGSDQDLKNSERVIAALSAGGLGLPDRDYYLKDDAKSVELRGKYVVHVAKMLTLAGDAPAAGAASAKDILRIETALATASLSRVDQRDPYKLYHVMKVEALATLAPDFQWKDYFTGAGLPFSGDLNVTEPEFFKALDGLLQTEALATWKSYLKWHLVSSRAAYLSEPFVEENFNFYRKTLRGVQEMAPRWKRCVQYVDQDLGEALGQVFVEKTFGPEVKAETVHMVKLIEDAMEVRIHGLDWMSDATKKAALQKLRTMRNKIGYPDQWRDYSALSIVRGDFLGNIERATVFESNRQLAKIGKPVDRGEWGMTPPTVNAYYNPQMNDMNFPAGVLQPPLFDAKMDAAPNYGNTGSTIGHELTHGFDDEGRQFDANGNLADWWTEVDGKEFTKRAQCVVDQYATYTVVDDIKIQSKLTEGEDVADLGGTILAYIAWKEATRGQDLKPADGLTPDQRFFVGFAQWACENARPEDLRLNAITNPHSPGIYRINGVVVNMPEFAQAFSCKAGQPMVKERDRTCRIW